MSNGSIIEFIGDLRVIRFSRPEIRSPLSISVLVGLHKAIDAIAADSAAAGLIFTGTGDVFASELICVRSPRLRPKRQRNLPFADKH